MAQAILLKCAHTLDVLANQQKLARKIMAQRFNYELPFTIQRGIWFSSIASFEGQQPSALALVAHLDVEQRIVPAPRERDVLRPPMRSRRKSRPVRNLAFLIGSAKSYAHLLLADVLPPYLGLVSNLPTSLLTEASLADSINRSFGWRYSSNPIPVPKGFVTLEANSDPFSSICARAIAYGRKAPGENCVFVDSLGIGGNASPVLLANDDARNLAARALENWESTRSAKREVVEVMPSTESLPAADASLSAGAKDILDRQA